MLNYFINKKFHMIISWLPSSGSLLSYWKPRSGVVEGSAFQDSKMAKIVKAPVPSSPSQLRSHFLTSPNSSVLRMPPPSPLHPHLCKISVRYVCNKIIYYFSKLDLASLMVVRLLVREKYAKI